VTCLSHFQRLKLNTFRLAVYYHIKVLLARKKQRLFKIKDNKYINSWQTDPAKRIKNEKIRIRLITYFLASP